MAAKSIRECQPEQQQEPMMSTPTSRRPAIARVWRGRTKRDRTNEYAGIPRMASATGDDAAPASTSGQLSPSSGG